ncbi:MAG: cyclic nucleotide-binding domain-containing protein [Patescibacteria group bacterium]
MPPADFEAIQKLPLFKGLDKAKHGAIIAEIEQQNFAAGEFIFREGDASQQIYVVQSGEVEIVRVHDQIAEEVAFLKVGDVFGELGSLGDKARNASARAFVDAKILVLNRDTVAKLSAEVPDFDTAVGARYLERDKANADYNPNKLPDAQS